MDLLYYTAGGEDGGEELILLYDNADDDILRADNEANEAMVSDSCFTLHFYYQLFTMQTS